MLKHILIGCAIGAAVITVAVTCAERIQGPKAPVVIAAPVQVPEPAPAPAPEPKPIDPPHVQVDPPIDHEPPPQEAPPVEEPPVVASPPTVVAPPTKVAPKHYRTRSHRHPFPSDRIPFCWFEGVDCLPF